MHNTEDNLGYGVVWKKDDDKEAYYGYSYFPALFVLDGSERVKESKWVEA